MLDRETAVLFARHYIECGHAADAASFSNLILLQGAPQGRPYVYVLLTSDLSRVLYVGKGRGKRAQQHVRDVKAGRVSGVKKHRALQSELIDGRDPVPFVLGWCSDDVEALAIERAVIRTIGVERLANGSSGSVPAIERWRAMRARVVPMDTWLAEKPRTSAQQAIYRAITAKIDQLIADPMARAQEIEIVNGKVRITQGG